MKPFIVIAFWLVILFAKLGIAQNLTGFVFADSNDLYEYPISFFATPTKVRNIDWSHLMPPAGNQGQQASCISWIVGYGLLGFLKAQAENKPYITKQQDFPLLNAVFGQKVPDATQVFSPSYLYNLHQIKYGKPDCKNGMSFEEAFDLFDKYGCPLYAHYPYISCLMSVPKKSLRASSNRYSKLIYNSVPPNKEQFKAQLANKRIILLGIKIDSAFKTLDQLVFKTLNQKDSIWKISDKPVDDPNHAVICVGYVNKHFKMLNSWGTKFGKNGYFYVPENDIDTSIILRAFVVTQLYDESQLKASFTKQVSGKTLGVGEYITDPKSKVKYELVALQKDSTAIIVGLSPNLPTPYRFQIRVGETKAKFFADTIISPVYFTYTEIANKRNTIEVDFGERGVIQSTKEKKSKSKDSSRFDLFAQISSPLRQRYQNALNQETRAFDSLSNGNIKEAQRLFNEVDNIYPEFHSAYEASKFLRQQIQISGEKATKEQGQQLYREIDRFYWRGGNRDALKKLNDEN
jgi:Papain family cysteine protease